MSTRLCPDCGANLALVGVRHNCRMRLQAILPTAAGLVPHRFCDKCEQWVPKTAIHTCAVNTKPASPNAHVPSPNIVASPNKQPHASPNRKAARNYRWRAKNRDRYRAYQREYMRRRREAERQGRAA